MDLGRITEKLFGRWPNRCPIDGGFVTLEEEDGQPGDLILRCGWVHYITLEHWVAAHDGCPVTHAIQALQDLLGDVYRPHAYPYGAYFNPVPLDPVEEVTFTPGDPYWEGRGFDLRTQANLDMGTVNGKPGMVYRTSRRTPIDAWLTRDTTIPENTIVPARGSKYSYHKNAKRLLWGEAQARVLRVALGVSWIVLAEGCADAARFLQAGIPAVSTSQPSITMTQALHLLGYAQNFIIGTDNDRWGQDFLRNGVGRQFLVPFANIDWLLLDRKDACLYAPDELHALFVQQFPLSGLAR